MNQVAKKEKSDVALTSMFEQDQAGGMDQMGQGDFAMPFLRVLGQLSPEVNERDAKYVSGAKAGMIFNFLHVFFHVDQLILIVLQHKTIV